MKAIGLEAQQQGAARHERKVTVVVRADGAFGHAAAALAGGCPRVAGRPQPEAERL